MATDHPSVGGVPPVNLRRNGRGLPTHLAGTLCALGVLLSYACTTDVTGLAGDATITLTIATIGADLDSDGYQLIVDADTVPVTANRIYRFSKASGNHLIELKGLAANCMAAPGRHVVALAGKDVAVSFQVTCRATSAVIAITTTTTGTPGTEYYVVRVGSVHTQPIAPTDRAFFTVASAGSWAVQLERQPPGCVVQGENPRSIGVSTGGVVRDTARTQFSVTCAPSVAVVTTTTGADDGSGDATFRITPVPTACHEQATHGWSQTLCVSPCSCSGAYAGQRQ